jgi:NADH-quinone oxidoreductase subunit M
VAYSSISHMGFVVLGMFALNSHGVQGSILQMVNHGLSTGALFILVGMIYERRHTRDINAFGGIWSVMPIYGVFSLIVTLSSMGLPGLNGFVGEFSILLGAWDAGQPGGSLGSYLFAGIGAIGVILAAVYMLFWFQKLFLGPVDKDENRALKDINWREVLTMVPLIVFIFWIGLYPRPFFHLMGPTVAKLLTTVTTTAMH